MEPLKPTPVLRGCPGPAREPIDGGLARPCAFLDRDGVLNRDFGYVHSREKFEWIEGAKDAVRDLRAAGFWLVVVTNQSGIERGFYSESDFLALSQWMVASVDLDLVLYCPHLDSPCPARKPGIGMVETAGRLLPISLTESIFVGDKDTDMECAQAAGVKGLRYHESMGSLRTFLTTHQVLPL